MSLGERRNIHPRLSTLTSLPGDRDRNIYEEAQTSNIPSHDVSRYLHILESRNGEDQSTICCSGPDIFQTMSECLISEMEEAANHVNQSQPKTQSWKRGIPGPGSLTVTLPCHVIHFVQDLWCGSPSSDEKRIPSLPTARFPKAVTWVQWKPGIFYLVQLWRTFQVFLTMTIDRLLRDSTVCFRRE